MNTKNDIDALLDFYLFSDLEDKAAVDEYLNEEGIDFESFYKDLGTLIKKKKAELKIQRGKRIIEKYRDKLKKLKNNSPGTGSGEQEKLALAFHKKHKDLSEDEVKEIIEEAKKLDIIKNIIREDEQSDKS